MASLRGRMKPPMKEVRGLGMMIGILLDEEAVRQSPSFVSSGRTPAGFVVDQLNRAGLLTVPAGADVVRFLPPLTLTREEAEEGLDIFFSVVTAMGAA